LDSNHLGFLTANQVISGDHFVVKVTASWDATIPPGTMRITVEPAMVMASAEV
jgi:hypothetical protein